MKILFTISALLLSTYSFSQNYQLLIRQGDSLYKAKKYDSSLYTFEEAIEKLSKSDVPIPENDWQRIFMGAGNSASARGNSGIARKYWNLAKGSRGEKVDDKVNYLHSIGIQQLFTLANHGGGDGLATLNVEDCSTGINIYLFWTQAKDLYIQKFNECNTYRPLRAEKSMIPKLIGGKQIDKMKAEIIRDVNNYGHHTPTYEIRFYNGSTFETKTLKELDLTDPRSSKPKDVRISAEESLANYERNTKSALYQLLKFSNSDIEKYENRINSPSERLKVGKL